MMLKKFVATITAFALVIASLSYIPKTAQAAVASSAGSSTWKLVWNDEFNQTVGSAPNTEYWQYDIGTGESGWGNNEIQYYTNSTDNVYIAETSGTSDGHALAIKAKRDSDGTLTSGRIKTLDKVTMKYGRIEAKLRVENGQQNGVWPAFWMMGNDINSVGWPNCGEIDIMEHRNAETEIIGTLHWNPVANNATYSETYAGSETNGKYAYIDTIASWHTYAVEWYEDCVKWFVDGTCYETIALTDAMAEEFHKEHFILLNLALGGTSTPFTKYTTISDSFTDATMYVDYVRVYQGTDADFYVSKTTEGITQPEPTTVGDGYTTCVADVSTNVGAWNYLVCTSWVGAAAKYNGGESLDDFSMKVLASDGTAWGLQAFTNALPVTAGHTYNYSITMNSDTAGASVLLKDELGSTDLVTQTLTAGDNVFSGTYTPTTDNIEFMFDLGALTAGTTISITNVTLTDVTSEEDVSVTVSTETTSQSADTNWTTVDNSNNVFSYANSSNMTVVSVQRPGWASEDGIYMYISDTIGYITINGVQVGTEAAAINGGGAVIYLSALTAQISTIQYCRADGTVMASIDIKNNSVSEEDETTTPEPTTEEPTTEAPTTPEPDTTKAPETTTEDTSSAEPISPIGLNPTSSEDGKLTIVWGQDGEMMKLGQTYNVYVDDTLVLSNVACASYTVDATPGEHTVSIEAVLGGKVSEKLTASVVVQGTVEPTTPEPTTEEPTTPQETTTPEETTSQNDSSAITVSGDVKIEGYQISTTYEGFKVVGSVELTINGQAVSGWGLIYGLSKYGKNDYNITDDDMYVGTDHNHIKSYDSTPVGTMGVVMGDSLTATYFARTMKFGGTTANIYNAEYKVRAYAILADGSYVYSSVGTFTVYDIASYLYDNQLMNTFESHDYLYNSILKVVDNNYQEVDFEWNKSVIKPDEITW